MIVACSITGSRETCDAEGEDVTLDKLVNTTCYRCLCKVNKSHEWGLLVEEKKIKEVGVEGTRKVTHDRSHMRIPVRRLRVIMRRGNAVR